MRLHNRCYYSTIITRRQSLRTFRSRTAAHMTQPGVGKWTRDEHMRYLQAIKLYPQGPWQSVANFVGTRSARQTQTHAQKYREKVSRRKRGLLRKRAMSDDWMAENLSPGEDKTGAAAASSAMSFSGAKFYPHSQMKALPALSALSDQPPLQHMKSYYDSQQHLSSTHASFPHHSRLPVLEPLHPPGGYATADKAFPGSFQSSTGYAPSTSYHHHHHHHHQQPPPPPQNYPSYTSQSFKQEYKQEYLQHTPSSYATSSALFPPSSMHDYHVGHRGGPPPPLDDLMQLFVDGEFMAQHR
ncbi:hypothetical protein DYB28_002838 [Aphanomyces astaci]|uniref:Uncharacterized protein n=2 Tax=Aphanomyces astaci TaxID=112090 RepID=A0A397DQN1_APHAT|nr:hypothetical protein DYB25_005036 [Aphanomyces astaci]RHY62861.1 hypothetical protein DYB34_012599 [Aphanomyces astaci]RHY66480.1 hypothetical protein DYB30_003618 [Aphanomyces astaci]RHY70706.1 hypothetical protein DYB38_005786 [Aphanomyces astaci]RHZ30291.1 hypothetical protein DYB26_006823 [Aphanomyces astaci]